MTVLGHGTTSKREDSLGKNQLVNSQSAYLLQHANNPIDWWMWTQDAFVEARQRNVPVFVSIGYSACHWCHVMAHESFEDLEIAKFLNENFVAIKVDREEHPDVDAIYMDAVLAMSGHGGWPLSVFLTPDGLPFYGGTYFPPHDGTSIPSFGHVISEISRIFHSSPGQVQTQAANLRESIVARSSIPRSQSQATIDAKVLLNSFTATILSAFDSQWGGTGRAPKFLQPHLWSAMADAYLLSGDHKVLEALTTTLDAVVAGGIYDHIAGGFARYSTDAFWMVPHFEKMLYDQALNAQLYLRAYVITQNPDYLQVTTETIDFVLTEMIDGHGLFAASFDADSSGEEGVFYTFRKEEIEEVLSPAAAAEFIKFYGVTKSGNFEARNILHRSQRGSLARSESLEQSRRKLYQYRSLREAPGLDQKAVVEWNAMFITTLAEAGFRLDRLDYLQRAAQAFDLVYQRGDFAHVGLRLAEPNTRANPAMAVLGDWAHLMTAAVALAQFSGDPKYTQIATSLGTAIVERFKDPQSQGFLSTSRLAPRLIADTADIFDSAYPSANAVAARAFHTLGVLGASPATSGIAQGVIDALAETITSHPSAFPHLVSLVASIGAGSIEMVIPGVNPELLDVARTRYMPNLVLAYGQSGTGELWEYRQEGKGYLCRSFSCLAPVSTALELSNQLESIAGSNAL